MQPHLAPAWTINGLLTALVAELVEAEVRPGFDPLDERLTLGAILADLCRLAGESAPAPGGVAVGVASFPAGGGPAHNAGGGAIAALCDRLLAELVAEGVPRALGQRFTLAPVCADLCLLAGEPLSADLQSRLGAPAAG